MEISITLTEHQLDILNNILFDYISEYEHIADYKREYKIDDLFEIETVLAVAQSYLLGGKQNGY